MDPINATSVENLLTSTIPGAFKFGADNIGFICPCGCSGLHVLPLREGTGHPSWTWDGNVEKPTLSPSIRDVGRCFFHGHLQVGVWTFEPDSGVKR